MAEKDQSPLTIRERVTLRLILFLIQMISPYQYEHQFKEFFAEVKAAAGIKKETP